jgi:hypothetical protein
MFTSDQLNGHDRVLKTYVATPEKIRIPIIPHVVSTPMNDERERKRSGTKLRGRTLSMSSVSKYPNRQKIDSHNKAKQFPLITREPRDNSFQRVRC